MGDPRNPSSYPLWMGTRLGTRPYLSSNSGDSRRFFQLSSCYLWGRNIPKKRTNSEMGKERKAHGTSWFVSTLSELGETLLLFTMEASLVRSSSLRLSCH